MIEWNGMFEINEHKKRNLDLLTEFFQLLTVDAAKDIFGCKKYNNRSVNWLDENLHSLLSEKNKIKNKISHLKVKIKKHFGKIRNTARSMKKQLKNWKHKQNKIHKKLYKCKYKNILKATTKFEKLINDRNVDKEKLLYEAVNMGIYERRHHKLVQNCPFYPLDFDF